MREAELVFRTMQHPADEGTHYARWGLVGLAGAVVLTAIMWDDPDSDTARSMDTMWRQRFGHPMHPLWADLGFHSRRPLPYEAPTEEACEWLRGKCHYDGSGVNAQQLGRDWQVAGLEPDWIREGLANYYHDVFYDERNE